MLACKIGRNQNQDYSQQCYYTLSEEISLLFSFKHGIILCNNSIYKECNKTTRIGESLAFFIKPPEQFHRAEKVTSSIWNLQPFSITVYPSLRLISKYHMLLFHPNLTGSHHISSCLFHPGGLYKIMLTSEWTRIQQLPDVILLRSLVTGQPGTYGTNPVSKFIR